MIRSATPAVERMRQIAAVGDGSGWSCASNWSRPRLRYWSSAATSTQRTRRTLAGFKRRRIRSFPTHW